MNPDPMQSNDQIVRFVNIENQVIILSHIFSHLEQVVGTNSLFIFATENNVQILTPWVFENSHQSWRDRHFII